MIVWYSQLHTFLPRSGDVMKLALQSIVFGTSLPNFHSMCESIRSAGYSGIELFQDFTSDAYKKPNADREYAVEGIMDAVLATGMTLVGVASGSLRERIAFVEQYGLRLIQKNLGAEVPYVYVDEWNEVCELALRRGVKLAIHPHMFRPIQTIREAEDRLDEFPIERFPNLQLMPDTAHMTIAGDNPVDVVKKHFRRIHSLHVKDWNPNVGRSYQFYASGFCDLGAGRVQVKETLDHMWKSSYRGWFVVEHDYSTTPEQTMTVSRAWLASVLPPTYFHYT